MLQKLQAKFLHTASDLLQTGCHFSDLPTTSKYRKTLASNQTKDKHYFVSQIQCCKSNDIRNHSLRVRTFLCDGKPATTVTCTHAHHFHRHRRMSFFDGFPVLCLPRIATNMPPTRLPFSQNGPPTNVYLVTLVWP